MNGEVHLRYSAKIANAFGMKNRIFSVYGIFISDIALSGGLESGNLACVSPLIFAIWSKALGGLLPSDRCYMQASPL